MLEGPHSPIYQISSVIKVVAGNTYFGRPSVLTHIGRSSVLHPKLGSTLRSLYQTSSVKNAVAGNTCGIKCLCVCPLKFSLEILIYNILWEVFCINTKVMHSERTTKMSCYIRPSKTFNIQGLIIKFFIKTLGTREYRRHRVEFLPEGLQCRFL